MGLDMYLEVRRNVRTTDWGKDFEKVPNELGQSLVSLAGLDQIVSENNYVVSIEVNAIYWRKANAIHQWFVDNIGKGVDECQRMYLQRKDLEDLRDLVKDVLIHREKAQVALPPQAGFFFGSTEIDEWYWEDMEYTAKELDRVLMNTFEQDVDFFYQASW
jgi:hypothetical protein